MNRKEFRIVLPLTISEYKIGQLFATAEASKHETGGGEGVVVIANKAFEENGKKGQYTKKFFYLESKIPKFIKVFMPKGSLFAVEESWNCYPHCKTVVTNPDYMGENFKVCIESLHLSDLGSSENVHNLPTAEWRNTEVINIDIANDPISSHEYKKEFDPHLFRSANSGRGPLKANWIENLKATKRKSMELGTTEPAYMCAYKLVSCHFKWFGLQSKVENSIFKIERRVFTNFHRQLFCWMDMWYGLTIEEIRVIEENAKRDLDNMRARGSIKGTVFEHSP